MKLKCDKLLSNVAFNCSLRHYGLDAVYVFFAHPEDPAVHRANLVDCGEPDKDIEVG